MVLFTSTRRPGTRPVMCLRAVRLLMLWLQKDLAGLGGGVKAKFGPFLSTNRWSLTLRRLADFPHRPTNAFSLLRQHRPRSQDLESAGNAGATEPTYTLGPVA